MMKSAYDIGGGKSFLNKVMQTTKLLGFSNDHIMESDFSQVSRTVVGLNNFF